MQTLTISGNVLVDVLIYIFASILLLVFGVLIGYYFVNQRYIKAGKSAAKIIQDAENAAEEHRKAALLDCKKICSRVGI